MSKAENMTHEKDPGLGSFTRCGWGVHLVTLVAEGEAPTCRECWRKREDPGRIMTSMDRPSEVSDE